ncbi:MAG: hypothetical protein ACN4GW_13575 [Desulforhopalus sp.]
MSIRALAKDVYRAQQKFNRLEKDFMSAEHADKQALSQKLKLAEQELLLLRKMLDGEKESGDFRKKFDGFGSSKR